MKKIKIMRLLTYSFLVCNAYSAKSTDIIFSVFGTEMIASEMVDRGILVKKRIECTAKYKPEEPQIKEQRSVNDIYQLSFFSSDGACLRLKIETENTKTRIILLKVDSLKSYAISAYDYADCVDYILSGGEYFKELNQNGEFSFIPDVIIAGSDIRDGAEKEFNSEYSISCAGHDIRSRGSFFNLKKTIYSAGNEVKLEVVPQLGINPIIKSVFITSTETKSSNYKQNSSYRASLIDGLMSANTADISVYKFENIKINFDASIIDV